MHYLSIGVAISCCCTSSTIAITFGGCVSYITSLPVATINVAMNISVLQLKKVYMSNTNVTDRHISVLQSKKVHMSTIVHLLARDICTYVNLLLRWYICFRLCIHRTRYTLTSKVAIARRWRWRI